MRFPRAPLNDFIVHYRSQSDALQIVREIEFDLWYVAQSLGATPGTGFEKRFSRFVR